MSVSLLAENLHGSEIIKIAGEINELKKQGQNIANLTIGDFDADIYPIPAELRDGMLSLRESVSAFLNSTLGLNYAANQILISGGSRPLIYSAYLALVDPGDK